MAPVPEQPASVAFGRFQVLPHRRELLADGRPLKLGGRAYDVLMALIEARGAVVSRNALMARVWPDRVVEENALPVQISALRMAFGPERELIRTVVGRGYQFTGEIRAQSPIAHAGAADAPGSAMPPTNLPRPLSELIGRDDELREVIGLATSQRLVTLIGPGGIGKTRLALAVAHELLPRFTDGIWLVELASLTDPGLVAATVATAARLDLGAGTASPARVADALTGKQLLVVLDNCEHVIGAAAMMAEALVRANPTAHVIATSRESLMAEGERVVPVSALAVPAEHALDSGDVRQYGAVRLFLERARAADARFAPDQGATGMIAAICRRLDGIPLAIELAAARTPALGAEALAALLDNRFHLLTDGRRTALPRHRTLRATLDWSFELLTAEERVILRRLAIFAGPFDLEAASAVLASAELTPSDVVGGVADLIAKSLVAANLEVAGAPFRLLDTMRAYALEKLGESGEREWLARRHAEYHRDLFERGESEWASRPAAEWLAYYGRRVDNLRAALDWAFSPRGDAVGDAPIGVALTAAAVPLWMQLSLLDECRDRTEQALLALGLATRRDARAEMKLQAALAASLAYTRAATVPEVGAAWKKAFEIAQSLDDGDYQLRSLLGFWSFHNRRGENRVALGLAERFCSLAANRSDANDRLVGERIIGTSHFSLGDLHSARDHFERALAGGGRQDHRDVIRYQADSRIAVRNCMAWILWLQGFLDQAMRAAETTVAEARATNHVNSICYALALCACPIALSIGDQAAAESYLEMLLDYTARHAQPRWRASGRNHQGVLAIRRGDVGTGLRLLSETLDAPGAANSGLMYPMLLGFFAEASGTIGRASEGLAAIEQGLAYSERHEERWCLAELLRIKGELLLLHRADGAAAEDHFRQALDWADRQGALFWELRAATSLARLMRAQDRAVEAIAVLVPVYDRFSEGFETADLKVARTLLDDLQ